MQRFKGIHILVFDSFCFFPIMNIGHNDPCRKPYPTDDQVAIILLLSCSSRQTICLNRVVANAKFEFNTLLKIVNRVQMVRKGIFVAIPMHNRQSQPFSLLYVS